MPLVRKPGPAFEPSSARIWRAIALLSLATVVMLLALPQRAPASGAAPTDQAAEDDAATERGTQLDTCRRTTGSAGAAALQRHIKRLERARSADDRCAALDQLARDHAAPDSVMAMIGGYARPSYDFVVRQCAISALGRAGNPASLTLLLGLCTGDAAAALADPLAAALALRDEDAALVALRSFARDSASPLRVPAAIALLEREEPNALELIVELLEDADDNLQYQLVNAISGSRDPHALAVLESLVSHTGTNSGVIHAIGALGTPDATRVLLQLLKKNSAHTEQVLNALATSPDPGARRALLAAASGGQGTGIEPRQALEALRMVDGEDVSALMLRALEAKENWRITAATEYFAAHGDPRAIAPLTKLLKGGARSANNALDALRQIGGSAATAIIEEVALTSGPLQSYALSSLRTLPNGAERARAIALELVERGGHDQVSALETLGSDPSAQARDALMKVARRADFRGEQAIALLGQRSDPESRKLLVELARSDSRQRVDAMLVLARARAPEAAGAVRVAIQRADDPQTRSHLLMTAAALPNKDAESILLQATRDASPDVASAAASYLRNIDTPAAVDRLSELASSPNAEVAMRAIDGLAELAPDRAAAIVSKLTPSSSPEQLRGALYASSSLPPQVAVQVMQNALSSKDVELVETALHHSRNYEASRTQLSEVLAQLAQNARMPESVRALANDILTDSDAEERIARIRH